MEIKKTLNFKEFGAGKPIIIIHGLFGMLDNWQNIARRLANNFLVYTIDLPNHGTSPRIDGLFNYEIMAQSVLDFMEEQWIHQAHIIGHSMGGKVAMQIALNNPDAVNKLALIDISPKIIPGGHEKIFYTLQQINPATVLDRKEVENYLMEKLEKDIPTVQFLMKNLSRNITGEGFHWKMNLPVLFDNYDNICAAVTGTPFQKPTLFVRGSKSNYIKDSDWDFIKTLFPEARLETIEDAGHWVHADKPNELFEIFENFFHS